MKNLKEHIISIGGWFKPKCKHYHDRMIPYFAIKTCGGNGDRYLCNSAKCYMLDKSSFNKVAVWKIACMNCKRRWTSIKE